MGSLRNDRGELLTADNFNHKSFDQVILSMSPEDFSALFSTASKEQVMRIAVTLGKPAPHYSAQGELLTGTNFHRSQFRDVFLAMTEEETVEFMEWYFPGLSSKQIEEIYFARRAEDSKKLEPAVMALHPRFRTLCCRINFI